MTLNLLLLPLGGRVRGRRKVRQHFQFYAPVELAIVDFKALLCRHVLHELAQIAVVRFLCELQAIAVLEEVAELRRQVFAELLG